MADTEDRASCFIPSSISVDATDIATYGILIILIIIVAIHFKLQMGVIRWHGTTTRKNTDTNITQDNTMQINESAHKATPTMNDILQPMSSKAYGLPHCLD
jgi:uncharacterized membrane protein